MMTAQQFTPPQLLEAGHRAEVDGRLDQAAQFYRHLTEHYAFTPEAAEAHNGLGRISTSPHHVWQQNGHANGVSHAFAIARPQRRRASAPRDHYPLGRALSALLTSAGWLTITCGLGTPAIHFAREYFTAIAVPFLSLVQVLSIGATLAGIGLLVLCFGLIAGALFDQANAIRDLVALERAKAAD